MKTNFSKVLVLVLISVSATAALYTRNTKQFNNESAILLEDIEASSCSLNDLLEFFFDPEEPTYWRWNHNPIYGKELTEFERATGSPAEIDLILNDRIKKYGEDNVTKGEAICISQKKNTWEVPIVIKRKGNFHSFSWESTKQETVFLEKGKDVNWHEITPDCSEWYQNEPETFKI